MPLWQTRLILYAPAVIFSAFVVLLVIPYTRSRALWLLKENNPVELATFIFFLCAGALGFRLTVHLVKSRHPLYISLFYLLFSTALVVIAMEEVAWGQWFFHFKTPEYLLHVNAQQETTLHNIGFLQGKSELFRLFFGLGGLLGIFVCRIPKYKDAGAPGILFPWFLIITAHALLDVYNDYFPIQQQFDIYVQRTSELVELLIAMSAFLYVLLNSRRLSAIQQTAKQTAAS